MIFYDADGIVIRNMETQDAGIFTQEEIAQGWDASIDKYEMRLRNQADGKCVSLTAEYHGRPAGYVNIYFSPKYGPFVAQGYPEIVDFGVLEKYRRHGIGGKLMDIAEQIASELAGVVWLGVGLHSGYGSAQRLYVKRGYIPDGSGVWYRDQTCEQNAACRNDDELVLYLSKKLK